VLGTFLLARRNKSLAILFQKTFEERQVVGFIPWNELPLPVGYLTGPGGGGVAGPDMNVTPAGTEP
jgi:hypothetical protein